MSNTTSVAKVCAGLVLPIVNEDHVNPGARAFLYLIGLLWCFLGIAIIADVFMCSIEKITSRTRMIRVANPDMESGFEEIQVKVWNDTVANLTLMALGSSAPEILLAIIEIVGNKFEAGALGPSTIVGSAAFNLLVICGVCCVAIPSPETRRIEHIKVFGVTAVSCVFAYVWLLLVLVVITPDYVDLWEAIITLLFFPILVLLAYMADRNFCLPKKVDDTKVELGFVHGASPEEVPDVHYIPWMKRKRFTLSRVDPDDIVSSGRMDERKMREFIKELRKLYPDMSEEETAKLAAARLAEQQTHNHLWYRINATRHMGGGHKLTPTMTENLNHVFEHLKKAEEGDDLGSDINLGGSFMDMSEGNTKAVVEFTASSSAVLERDGRVRVGIRRYGKLSHRVVFRIETIDGTAESGKDYIPLKQTLVFEKDETSHFVDVEIIDDNEWEPDEVFFVKLALDINDPGYDKTIVGKKAIMEVTIINDDEPGSFEFSKPSLLFKESCGKALIPVERSNGADGRVEISWKTEDMTARTGQDYEGGEGVLVFEHGEMSKTIEIVVYDDQDPEKDEAFRVELVKASSPGAAIGRVKRTIVTVVNDDDFNGMVSRLVDLTNTNMDSLRIESHSWTDQFRNAMNVNGGNLEGASHMDYVMHFLTFAWKVLFAIVPPVSIWGGWLSFFTALVMIGLTTMVVGDLASIFGCIVGLKDEVTAITFVALGTSLPDLFASKQAATQEKTADNSIGNVTGSNSVNVFLGLGLPWVIASIYHVAKKGRFRVERGSLTFSVTIYCVLAVLCLGFLMVRRFVKPFGKAELGGNKILKIVTLVFFCFMWFLYVLLSSLQAYGHIQTNF